LRGGDGASSHAHAAATARSDTLWWARIRFSSGRTLEPFARRLKGLYCRAISCALQSAPMADIWGPKLKYYYFNYKARLDTVPPYQARSNPVTCAGSILA
jgi:hypothetical protein